MKYWWLALGLGVLVVVLPYIWWYLGSSDYRHDKTPKSKRPSRATRRARALAPVPEEISERDSPEPEGESLYLALSTEIPDGCFIVETYSEEYVTLWLHREGNDRQISYLRGPDNTAGYVVFARALPNVVQVYHDFAETPALVAGLTELFGGGHVQAHERFLRDSAAYADHTGCCGRCGHRISNDVSVWRGLGPECFNKAGTWRLC